MPDTLTKKGDRVIGDILIATGRTISKVDLVNATSTHKGMQCKIKGKEMYYDS